MPQYLDCIIAIGKPWMLSGKMDLQKCVTMYKCICMGLLSATMAVCAVLSIFHLEVRQKGNVMPLWN